MINIPDVLRPSRGSRPAAPKGPDVAFGNGSPMGAGWL